MTSQQRADEYLTVWQALRRMGLSPQERDAMIDRLLAEERFFRAVNRVKDIARTNT